MAESGKLPDAREWLKIRHHFKTEEKWLLAYRRQTLLAAAEMFEDCGSGWPAALRRLAEEAGRQ